jgi:BlaR1 peptidase M56
MADGWLLPQLLEHGVALLGTAIVLNALVTFVGALGLALLASRVVGSARLAKLILITPWLRVLWDVTRGAAPNAYVLSEHAGTKGALGSFQLGIGARPPLTPVVHAQLEMQGGDQRYGYSVGDMLAHGVFRHVGAVPLLIVLGVLLAVSVGLLAARARHALLWRTRLARAQAAAVAVSTRYVTHRRVQIVTCARDALGPFTSGILRPRIWLPLDLQGSEREAVLEHELAHVRDLDVLWFSVAGILADVFWFVPGARYLERRLHERAEEAADARAVARGVAPKVLAHSILARAGAPLPGAPPVRMVGTAARLQRRLLALTSRSPESKKRLALRLVVALSLTLSVFRSVFFGYA